MWFYFSVNCIDLFLNNIPIKQFFMKPINTALCSFGMSGLLFHAPFIHVHQGFNFYGVLERTKNLAQQKYPSVKTFRTLEALLADDNIELVIVNTPSITHFEMARQVILSGKHLVVEKPFTATVAQAETLIELADKKNVKLSVYQNRRYDSDFRTVKKILQEGWLGDIVDAAIHYDRYVPALSLKNHKEEPALGVGCLYDLGSHLIDQAIQLFGMPKAISADIAINRPSSKVDDYFDLKLFYSTHRMTLKSSYYVREALPGYIFHGTKGSFIKAKTDVQETALLAGVKPDAINWGIEPENEKGLLNTEKDGKIIKEYIKSEKGNYMHFFDSLYNAIINNSQVPVTAFDGSNVIKVITAAIKSNIEMQRIEL